jgi:hypothetical protein
MRFNKYDRAVVEYLDTCLQYHQLCRKPSYFVTLPSWSRMKARMAYARLALFAAEGRELADALPEITRDCCPLPDWMFQERGMDRVDGEARRWGLNYDYGD